MVSIYQPAAVLEAVRCLRGDLRYDRFSSRYVIVSIPDDLQDSVRFVVAILPVAQSVLDTVGTHRHDDLICGDQQEELCSTFF